jgi:hypothetical protein
MMPERPAFTLGRTTVTPVAFMMVASVKGGKWTPPALLLPAHAAPRRTRAHDETTRTTSHVVTVRTPAHAETVMIGLAVLPQHHHAADVNVRRMTALRTQAFANPEATTVMPMPQSDADSEF